jgi:hypothetical protein
MTIAKIFSHIENDYNYPTFMKRNARYRGHRESEKYLNAHQEQVWDIQNNYYELDALTNNQNQAIESWFNGETEKTVENVMFSQTKSFQTYSNQSQYLLYPGISASSFSSIVVQLNNKTLAINVDYTVGDGYLNLTKPTDGTCTVSFTVNASIPNAMNTGIFSIKNKLQALDERLGELEKRRQNYEDAYK